MSSRRQLHTSLLEALRETLLGPRGVASVEARQSAMAGQGEGELAAFLQKVQTRAWTVTAEEVEALRAKHSDDTLFDLVLCAGYGAARRRHEVALAALDAAWEDQP